mgnify:CR=1 FL=1
MVLNVLFTEDNEDWCKADRQQQNQDVWHVLEVIVQVIRRGVVLFKREGGYLFDILCRIRRVLCRIGNTITAAQIEAHGF